MDSKELIRTFLRDRLGVEADRITDDAVLADLGVDSLMLAELMFEAEDRLGISIGADEAAPHTVGDMRAVIDRLVASKTETGA
jgi:acyl carrier protein